MSRDLLVRAIIVISMNGRSITVMSSSRPAAPIVGVCADQRSRCTATLLWGVIPVTVSREDLQAPIPLARRIAGELNLASTGHTILVVQGFSFEAELNTPSVTVVTV